MLVVDLPILKEPILAKNAQQVAAPERQRQAVLLSRDGNDVLSDQVVNVERRGSISICIVPMYSSGFIDVFKVSLDDHTANIKLKLEPSKPDTNLLQLSTHQELQSRCGRKWMHVAKSIANP